MNSDGQVVVVHAVQNKEGQVGFFVESSDENTRQLRTSCVSRNGGTNNLVEYTKKCFNDYERAVASTTERLKKNPVLQMYYNNPPTAQSGHYSKEQVRVANNMIFCRNPFQNQVWYRFRSEGRQTFHDEANGPAETSYEQHPIHSGVQANVKEPLAYNLTFVPVSKRRKKKLPEIKVLVPTSDDELKKHRKKKKIPAEGKVQQGDEGKMGEDKAKQDGGDKSRHGNEDKSRHGNEDKSRHGNEDKSRHGNEDKSRHRNEDNSRRSDEEKSRRSKERSRRSKERSRRSKERSRRSKEDKSRRSKEDMSRRSKEDNSRRSKEDKSRRSDKGIFSIEVKMERDVENGAKQEEDKRTRSRSRQSRDRKRVVKDDGDRKKTLQEYLRANRPDFIERADKRRQCLADLALLRDLRKQKYYELLELNRKLRLRNRARERARTRTRSEARRWARMQRIRQSSSSTSCSSSYLN